MKIKRLTLTRFTAFEKATFDFASGVNTLIGENGTGKSHVLKILYVLHEAARRAVADGQGAGGERFDSVEEAVAPMLAEVFQPDNLGRLVRRGVGRRKASIRVEWSDAALTVTLTSLGKVSVETTGDLSLLKRAVFVPTREALSLFPGFISAWQERESAFDRTYYDLCVALDRQPLRGPRADGRGALLEPIERALGGKVTVSNGRFYIQLPDGDMEAPLVAEGLRKLAMIAYLIINGALTGNGVMFWDEPEASLNPKLAQLASGLVLGLAEQGVQLFLATHDYALGSELSLALEQRVNGEELGTFFALGRTDGREGVVVERAPSLAELQTNPILEALASLHDRELASQRRPRD